MLPGDIATTVLRLPHADANSVLLVDVTFGRARACAAGHYTFCTTSHNQCDASAPQNPAAGPTA